MAYLDYGLHKSEGFIVITGEVGAGKTTVVRNLLSTLDPSKVVAAQLVTTHLGADDTLRMVGACFGLAVQGMSKSEMLLSIEAFLVKLSLDGKRGLLIVDEAQNLTPHALEELRMLSNYQLENHGLLQSFLVGQPEFRRILESPGMLQLRQRVVAGCHISPMDAGETRAYIEHRLTHVGWKEDPRFDPAAYEMVHEATDGIPRRINTLCDRLLLAGYLAGTHEITPDNVTEAAREIREETQKESHEEPDSAAMRSSTSAETAVQALGLEAPDIDTSKLHFAPDTESKLSRLIDRLQAAGVEERLARLERANAATVSVLRHLLSAVRTRPSAKKDDT
jgi:putative secretion ATPase (PEP-CTERM system associated)